MAATTRNAASLFIFKTVGHIFNSSNEIAGGSGNFRIEACCGLPRDDFIPLGSIEAYGESAALAADKHVGFPGGTARKRACNPSSCIAIGRWSSSNLQLISANRSDILDVL